MNIKMVQCGLLIAITTLSGCASVHNGRYAEQVDRKPVTKKRVNHVTDNGLSISGFKNERLSTKYFLVINFTFENITSKWIKVEGIELDLDDEVLNRHVSIPFGDDIKNWSIAVRQKKAIERYNDRVMLAAMSVAGGVLAASGDDYNGIGKTAYVGGLTALTVDHVSERLSELQGTKLLPDSHLLSPGLSIPPGLFQRKWLLLYAEDPKDLMYMNRIFLTYTLANGEKEKVKLTFWM